MKKSFPDECLERANAATPGPWEVQHCDYACGGFLDDIFISHARQDVPELSRRLKIACDSLRLARMYEGDALDRLADKLEAPLMNKTVDT